MEKFYYQVLSHCTQMRNQYLKVFNKNFLDDTIFKEFIITCVGEEITTEKSMRLRIESRKIKKKPIVHRYNPEDKYQEEPPKYIFGNSSGNKVNNPKNLKLSDKINTDDDDDNEDNNEDNNNDEIIN
jgi:hypothetical protein